MGGKEAGVSEMFHYLGAFLVVGAPESLECAEHLTTLLTVFNDLNVPVAPEKLEGPATRLVFLGIEIDTKEMILRLSTGTCWNLSRSGGDGSHRSFSPWQESSSMPAKW